jgi:hypothetical protein
MKEYNYTILVGSCDKYYDLLKDFKYLFNKFVNHNNNIFYLLENQKFDNTINTTGSWTSRVLEAVEKVETDYILWAQDDYFFYKPLFNDLDEIINRMITYKIDKYMLCENSTLYTLQNYKFGQESLYTTSTQFAMWKKDFFKYCLELCNSAQSEGMDIWNFEVLGSQLLNSSYTHNIVINPRDIYAEAMKQGKPTKHYFSMIEEIDRCQKQ